eukprot:scpid36671/ scgid3189/ Solute carrier family 41 member 2
MGMFSSHCWKLLTPMSSLILRMAVRAVNPWREKCPMRPLLLTRLHRCFFPYMMSGFGTVGAGLLLDHSQHFPVFLEIPELFILVPALLGLKGNLEMTLASRLSTQANLGSMDDRKTALKLCFGNLALAQTQALVVALIAAIVAIVLGAQDMGGPAGHAHPVSHWRHASLMIGASLFTASLASLILGCVMCLVVYGSHRLKIDPDNVATPIAASLGDITTLALLVGVSDFMYDHLYSRPWVGVVLAIVFLLTIPLWWTIARRNEFTCDVLHSGWWPVLMAMVISSGGGFILDKAVTRYQGIAVFAPVICGVGGNLVAIQASRLSTGLHQRFSTGDQRAVPENGSCCGTFRGSGGSASTARLLLFLTIPGHFVFLLTIRAVEQGGSHTSITPYFAVGYFVAAFLQVLLLLIVSNWLVHWLWRRGTDPDNSAIPYLTALGDLVGTALLAVAFITLNKYGDGDADVGD